MYCSFLLRLSHRYLVGRSFSRIVATILARLTSSAPHFLAATGPGHNHLGSPLTDSHCPP